MRAALEGRGVVLAEPGEVSPEHPLVVVPAPLAKGLEFDAVIVVEPAEIAEREPHGVRLLFVALTRAVQHLAIAHSRALPLVARDVAMVTRRSGQRTRLGCRRWLDCAIVSKSGSVHVVAEPGAELERRTAAASSPKPTARSS